MSIKEKIALSLFICLFYLPGYFFLFKEIGKDDYSLPSVVIGSFFTGFGLFGHSVVLFEKKWEQIESNQLVMKKIKYFFKIIGTIFTLPLGILCVFLFFTEIPDNYQEADLRFIKCTLSKKPEFHKGAKSSTSLNIFVKEFPEYCFEPRYNEFVHYNTNFEEETNFGDTVVLGILIEDYEKSVVKTKTKSYVDRHVNSNFIEVFYIESKSNVYYNPIVHNLLDEDENGYSWVVLIISIPFLFLWIGIWHTEIIKLLTKIQWNKLAAFLIKLRAKKIL